MHLSTDQHTGSNKYSSYSLQTKQEQSAYEVLSPMKMLRFFPSQVASQLGETSYMILDDGRGHRSKWWVAGQELPVYFTQDNILGRLDP